MCKSKNVLISMTLTFRSASWPECVLYLLSIIFSPLANFFFFFFNDTAPTEIYPLPLHDALPICHVVADDRRRPWSAKDRAGVANERQQRFGVGGDQLEVLGSDRVRRLDGHGGRVDQNGTTAGGQGGLDLRAAGRIGRELGDRFVDRVDEHFVPRDEDRGAVGAVLGLGDKVGGDHRGIG